MIDCQSFKNFIAIKWFDTTNQTISIFGNTLDEIQMTSFNSKSLIVQIVVLSSFEITYSSLVSPTFFLLSIDKVSTHLALVIMQLCIPRITCSSDFIGACSSFNFYNKLLFTVVDCHYFMLLWRGTRHFWIYVSFLFIFDIFSKLRGLF